MSISTADLLARCSRVTEKLESTRQLEVLLETPSASNNKQTYRTTFRPEHYQKRARG